MKVNKLDHICIAVRNLAQAQTKDLEAKFAARLESASARLESIAKAMK